MDQLSVIESSIKELWEKVRIAGETIVRLKEEKAALTEQKARLEQQVAQLRTELAAREERMQALQASHAKASAGLSNGEREHLTAKVKELLARIDAYL